MSPVLEEVIEYLNLAKKHISESKVSQALCSSVGVVCDALNALFSKHEF